MTHGGVAAAIRRHKRRRSSARVAPKVESTGEPHSLRDLQEVLEE